MTTTNWRYAFSSVVGTSHVQTDMPCQDACACHLLLCGDDDYVLVAVVSDGAGSAEFAETGAQLACSLFVTEMKEWFKNGGDVRGISVEFVKGWVMHFQNEIAVRAEAKGKTARDFACTVLASVVGKENAVFFQIGDGAIVLAAEDEPDEYNWIFWPQQGEFANVTMFATDVNALTNLEYDLIERHVDEVALFSDGLQRLALHFQSQTVHAPFFRSMFTPLRQQPEGFAEQLSNSLVTFLSSAQVNSRTDDDKTLILATRRNAPMQTVSAKEPQDAL